MRIFISIVICLLFLTASDVDAQKRWILKRKIKNLEEQFNNHSGLMIYDPENEKSLFEYKSEKYFTPASNTKILTLYTAFNVLGDTLPALYYKESGDSLVFWGTGDPSFLYRKVPENQEVISFLKNSEKTLYFSDANFDDDHYGPGWSWDDYPSYYQVERSPLPMYGNYVTVGKDSVSGELQSDNSFLKDYLVWMEMTGTISPFFRRHGDRVEYFPEDLVKGQKRVIPFRYSPELITGLLMDTLKKEVKSIDIPLPADHETLYASKADSVYKVLMQDSDNFIAEQLLLMCAGVQSDTLNSKLAINYSMERLLSKLPNEPQWVDGSGLSRYNLITPKSIVKIWEEIFRMTSKDKLFDILAVGGKAGTIKYWYANDPPYIYGKTGTLSNNHALSGYLINEEGKVLIFSFMHNHYPTSSSAIKKEMEKILWYIREKF